MILLREGLEAVLVVAAILALLVRAGRRDALPAVHAGWIVALLLGAITWAVASYVVTISGATREVTEGVTALVATVVLIWVGFWMHDKSHAARWAAYLRSRLQGALGRRAAWGLAAVSFIAVYREVFETVLFYEALWLQTAPGARHALMGGLAAAAVALVLLSWLIVRGSLRLPLGIFFGATSIVLAALAVVLAGKGIKALQEAAILHRASGRCAQRAPARRVPGRARADVAAGADPIAGRGLHVALPRHAPRPLSGRATSSRAGWPRGPSRARDSLARAPRGARPRA